MAKKKWFERVYLNYREHMGSLGLPVHAKPPYRNSNHYRYGHFCATAGP